MTIATALIIGGLALSAGGTIYAASKESEAAEYNAQLAEEAALKEEESAEREEKQFRRQAESFLSMQQALYAVSGIRLDEGSALDVIADSTEELEFDALAIRAGGLARSQYYKAQAESDRRAGRTALVTGAFKAGSSLLAGYSEYKWGN